MLRGNWEGSHIYRGANRLAGAAATAVEGKGWAAEHWFLDCPPPFCLPELLHPEQMVQTGTRDAPVAWHTRILRVFFLSELAKLSGTRLLVMTHHLPFTNTSLNCTSRCSSVPTVISSLKHFPASQCSRLPVPAFKVFTHLLSPRDANLVLCRARVPALTAFPHRGPLPVT